MRAYPQPSLHQRVQLPKQRMTNPAFRRPDSGVAGAPRRAWPLEHALTGTFISAINGTNPRLARAACARWRPADGSVLVVENRRLQLNWQQPAAAQ